MDLPDEFLHGLEEMSLRLPISRFSARTVPALLAETARRVPARVFLKYFEPESSGAPREVTFGEFRAMVMRAVAFFKRVGLKEGERVLLLGENSPEWQATAIAAQLLRAQPAVVFANMAATQVAELSRRIRPRVIFVSNVLQWQKIAPVELERAQAKEGEQSRLAAVLSLEELQPGSLVEVDSRIAFANAAGVFSENSATISFSEFESRAEAIGDEDPSVLLFTSGTTGRPKGVLLPQRSIVRAIDAGVTATSIHEADVGLHMLPFAHVAGIVQFALALAQGHQLLMIAKLDDVQRALAMAPTYIFSVPQLFEKIRRQVLQPIQRLPGPIRSAVERAIEAGARVRVDGSQGLEDRILARALDEFIGKKMKAAMGGRVRGSFVGGAPASEPLFRFFEGFGIPLIELYGMSETGGMISANLFHGKRKPLVAGLISPDHEFRISEDGELLLRGPLLFSGYMDPSDNVGAFTEDGFFKTGDRVQIDPLGNLRIIGRKKYLIVLSTGKKVSPEPIETAIGSTPPFQGAVLLGEGRPFVSVAVFVRRDELSSMSSSGSASGQDPEQVLLPKVLAALSKFSDYEKPKRLLVIPGEPQDYPGLITPTLKIRREALYKFLGESISDLYASTPFRHAA